MKQTERQQWLTEYKAGMGCAICGESLPVVLSLHHIDPETKDATVFEMTNNTNVYTDEQFFEEVAKCVVLCENCHRKLHWYIQDPSRLAGYVLDDERQEAAGLLEEDTYVEFEEVARRGELRAMLAELEAEWDATGDTGRPKTHGVGWTLAQVVELEYPGDSAPSESKQEYKKIKGQLANFRKRMKEALDEQP